VKKNEQFKTRDTMKVDDIDGAKPKFGHEIKERSEGFGKAYNYNAMDYRDVTNTQFKSSRYTNPLMPTYKVRNEDDKVHEIGPVEGALPNVLPPMRTDPNYQAKSLHTTDIQGCACSTKGLGNFHTRKRRAFLTTNITEDIPGAQPDTVKKSPETLRNTNPLMPDY